MQGFQHECDCHPERQSAGRCDAPDQRQGRIGRLVRHDRRPDDPRIASRRRRLRFGLDRRLLEASAQEGAIGFQLVLEGAQATCYRAGRTLIPRES